MKFSVSFDVTLPMGEVVTCFSEPLDQSALPEFITALTSAGHTLVEVHRIPLCDQCELYSEDIVPDEVDEDESHPARWKGQEEFEALLAESFEGVDYDEEPEEEVYIEEEECFDEDPVEPVDVDEFVNRQRADY